MPNPIPVLLLGRLAVDTRFERRGLGASLLNDAILKSVEVGRTVGVRALLVDALNPDAESFYLEFGFERMPDSERVLYLRMEDAERTVMTL